MVSLIILVLRYEKGQSFLTSAKAKVVLLDAQLEIQILNGL